MKAGILNDTLGILSVVFLQVPTDFDTVDILGKLGTIGLLIYFLREERKEKTKLTEQFQHILDKKDDTIKELQNKILYEKGKSS